MSRRRKLMITGGVLFVCFLAGAFVRSRRITTEQIQRDRAAAQSEFESRQKETERLEKLLRESETMSEQQREELKRELEKRRLDPGRYPPQFRPKPRPHLDPSRNPPQ